jgi:hypothetical protein
MTKLKAKRACFSFSVINKYWCIVFGRKIKLRGLGWIYLYTPVKSTGALGNLDLNVSGNEFKPLACSGHAH